MKKGIAKPGSESNIKPMAGGAEIAKLLGGQYVYGTLSAAKTDLMNFSHYYRADGTRVVLGKPCKVTTANLLPLIDEADPFLPTDPPVDPEPEPNPDPEPIEEPVLEYREVEFTQKFVTVNGQETLRVKIVNPNPTTLVEVFVSDGTRDEQWSKPE